MDFDLGISFLASKETKSAPGCFVPMSLVVLVYAGASATGESGSEGAETGKETTGSPPEVLSPQDDLESLSLTAAASGEQNRDVNAGW